MKAEEAKDDEWNEVKTKADKKDQVYKKPPAVLKSTQNQSKTV
jgi:hypothetical protein